MDSDELSLRLGQLGSARSRRALGGCASRGGRGGRHGMTSLLIGDGASPLYDGDARRSVTVAAFTPLMALKRGYPTANTIPS